MPDLRLTTLGKLRLESSDGDIVPGRRKELALVAYLARRSGRGASRDELATLLWGESDEAHARESLRQALLRLRRSLGDAVQATPDDARVLEGAIDLDVDAFERDVAEDRHADAVARWGGDFLYQFEDVGSEEFRGWLERERAVLRRLLARCFERLVAAAGARGDSPDRLRWAERWSELFPYEERAYLEQARALLAAGNVADARARLTTLAGRLRQELGEMLSVDVDALARELARATGPVGNPGSAALLAPDLVGRHAILASLTTLWEGVRTNSAVVLIEGEEGIGKTRLCAELMRRVRHAGEPALILETRADERDVGAPLSTVRGMLDGLQSAPGLLDVPNRPLREIAAFAPALRARFPNMADAVARPEALYDALYAVLDAIAQKSRIVLVIDDVATADHASRDLVRALIRRPPAAMLLVLTARTDSLADSGLTAELMRLPAARRVKLQPLTEADVDAFLASMLELEVPERARLVQRLFAETGGNPFYLAELVSALADESLLVLGADGRWRIAADTLGATLPLPPGVRGAIARRLANLDEDARQVIEAAAVLGRTADPELLESVAAIGPARFEIARDALIARRMLRQTVSPDASYELPHDLVRRAIYELTPTPRREALHRAAIAALEAHPDRSESSRRLVEYHGARVKGSRAAPRRDRSRHRRVGVAVVGALVLVGVALWQGRSALGDTRSSEPAPRRQRLIVAPFDNETGDRRLDPLGRIAAEWLTQGFATTEVVNVVPYGFVAGPERSVDPPTRASGPGATLARLRDLATLADADLAISGAYYKTSDSLRFEARITDTRRGEVLAVVRSEPAIATAPMTAVDELRRRTIATIAPRVDPRLAASAAVQSTPPTYESYLAFAQGLELQIDRRPEALGHFLRAYALDTTYTLPLLYAAMQYEGGGSLGALDTLTRRLMPRRTELPPFERHLLDFFHWRVAGEWSRALSAARDAAEIAPGSLTVKMYHAIAALALNRPNEAIEALQSVDPSRPHDRGASGPLALLAGAYHMVGDFEHQLEVAQKIRRWFPADIRYLSHHARALAAMGRFVELETVLEEALLEPRIRDWGAPGLSLHVVVADELSAHGHASRASAVLERALTFYQSAPRELQNDPGFRYDLARAYCRLARPADARSVLERFLVDYHDGDIALAPADLLAELGYVAAMQRDSMRVTEVRRILRDARDPYLYGAHIEFLAGIAALSGERDEAVRLLREAATAGRTFDSGKHLYFSLAPLRAYPPFERWLRPKG